MITSITRALVSYKNDVLNISVVFGVFFTYQVKQATGSLLLLLGDYLLQAYAVSTAVVL